MKQTEKIRKKWISEDWYVVNLITVKPSGFPDYLMIKQGQIDCYVESKELKDKLSELQKYRINDLLKLGKRVFLNDVEIFEPFDLVNNGIGF